MTYELVLLSIVVGAGYWGQFFVRRRPHGTITFGAMQLGAAGLAALGLWARHGGPEFGAIAGAVGVGAGACLLLVGPIVRGLARKLASAEYPAIAGRLFDLAELLAPGSGVADEKALLGAMREIREGRIEPTIEALTAAKARAPGEAKLAIDERIVMLYLAAYRWDDAIAFAETHLFEGALVPPPADGSLRARLGMSPPVWVELIGAYGRIGDVDHAARMLARLEDVCAGRPDGGVWLHRARLMLLALAGRVDAVRALVAPKASPHLSSAARGYWVAVAYEHRGEITAARAAYNKARSKSRGRPRMLIDEALAKLPELPGEVVPPAFAPETEVVLAHVAAAPVPVPRVEKTSRAPWATRAMTAAIVGVALAVHAFVGETSDIGVLVRAGAMVRGLIAHGEWWRLVTCVFLHVGMLHLLVNAMGLWFIGRIAEDLFGSIRTIAIFAAAGIAGSVASYLASPAGISAGASGAVFGLLGALFVELTWHKARYRMAWKRGMWGSIAVVTVAQLASDFVYPITDQWAHGAGLAIGGLAGALLSPNAPWAKAGAWLARALAAALVIGAVTAAVLVAQTPLAESFGAGPRARFVLGAAGVAGSATGQGRAASMGVGLSAPASWKRQGASELGDPDEIITVRAVRQPLVDAPTQLAAWIAAEGAKVRSEIAEEGGDPSEARWAMATAPTNIVALPAGWEGTEIDASYDDLLEARQHLRVILCAKPVGTSIVLVRVVAPESVARAVPALLADVIGSAGPV